MTTKIKLDQEEAELVRSIEVGEWTTVDNLEYEIKRSQGYARATFQKDRRVNIRTSTRDLHGLQKCPVEEGIPYQTLISSVLHKYLCGRLVERGQV
jgi:predicted DNA binding CopG/RHH family protein